MRGFYLLGEQTLRLAQRAEMIAVVLVDKKELAAQPP